VILRVIVFFNPLKVFVPMAGFLSIVGPEAPRPLQVSNLSETAVLCGLGAVIIGSVGLLADQNSRIALNPEPFEKQ
jgi:ABC-type cobalamin transport system permease subunit